jgi:hypothetical protein
MRSARPSARSARRTEFPAGAFYQRIADLGVARGAGATPMRRARRRVGVREKRKSRSCATHDRLFAAKRRANGSRADFASAVLPVVLLPALILLPTSTLTLTALSCHDDTSVEIRSATRFVIGVRCDERANHRCAPHPQFRCARHSTNVRRAADVGRTKTMLCAWHGS